MKEAMLYLSLPDEGVVCQLCAHRCHIGPGRRGLCGVRENRRGTLYSLVYGQLVAEHVDPIEKKPLFHFYPGSIALSIATVGCNLRCTFCQNADISQMPRDEGQIRGREVAAQRIVDDAVSASCQSIAYTYTEPTVFFEYTYDIALLAHQASRTNVYVSNGYMSREMIDLIAPEGEAPLIDAANIDLKAFTDDLYRSQCGATLQPVLDNLKLLKRRGVWLEVTTLIIPGLNDCRQELEDVAAFIAGELGVETPWHVSRFHPTYRLTDRPPTPVQTVHQAREIGLGAGLWHVYAGNVPGSGGEDTYCPQCHRVVIGRQGFGVQHVHLERGACADCGQVIAGVGLSRSDVR